MKRDRSFIYVLALLGAAFFWGTTFVAQNLGAGHVGTFTFLTLRSYVGTAFLLPFILVRDGMRKKKDTVAALPEDTDTATSQPKVPDTEPSKAPFWQRNRGLIIAGICCGLCLFGASALQQYGIVLYVADSDATGNAKSSFITALYVVLVPLASVFMGKKPEKKLWISVLLCIVGMYLLCITDSLYLTRGDLFILACAFGFTLQIIVLGHFSPNVSGLKLSALEFFTVAILATVAMFLFEKPTWEEIRPAMPTILYAGIFSNGIAYTLQTVGQKKVNPSLASLLMCLECVFGALSGWLVLHEVLSPREILGCALMFAAILLATLPAGCKTTGREIQ